MPKTVDQLKHDLKALEDQLKNLQAQIEDEETKEVERHNFTTMKEMCEAHWGLTVSELRVFDKLIGSKSIVPLKSTNRLIKEVGAPAEDYLRQDKALAILIRKGSPLYHSAQNLIDAKYSEWCERVASNVVEAFKRGDLVGND